MVTLTWGAMTSVAMVLEKLICRHSNFDIIAVIMGYSLQSLYYRYWCSKLSSKEGNKENDARSIFAMAQFEVWAHSRVQPMI